MRDIESDLKEWIRDLRDEVITTDSDLLECALSEIQWLRRKNGELRKEISDLKNCLFNMIETSNIVWAGLPFWLTFDSNSGLFRCIPCGATCHKDWHKLDHKEGCVVHNAMTLLSNNREEGMMVITPQCSVEKLITILRELKKTDMLRIDYDGGIEVTRDGKWIAYFDLGSEIIRWIDPQYVAPEIIESEE